ncbi:hypothetical protein LL936_11725 [Levilactobacillus brevis]|uniref:hypothetical protein n=1 Tax=Levilactobacillus brevis TaxID=1580 RepID=UPI001C1ED790|nr:hypothetical protein [Levilactobacillus brevis]MBU7560051.1 hypothetical protein [Levilactobacillus brevis]MBU7566878.1 hypothetical protein [Levilactobacillus brevis]MCE6011641.1 hypothetical protein [Levilactobacillus brevis]MCE6013985.1 hypothetical protein [Levilactobacillus brevis]MCE6016372.1 hypothetical protein [Levilactobacillus brevis]
MSILINTLFFPEFPTTSLVHVEKQAATQSNWLIAKYHYKSDTVYLDELDDRFSNYRVTRYGVVCWTHSVRNYAQ